MTQMIWNLPRNSRRSVRALAATTALLIVLPVAASAEGKMYDACALVNGVLPENCAHANAGTVVSTPVGANTETDSGTADLGPYGFAISVEAAVPSDRERRGVSSPDQAQSEMRRVDRMLDAAGVAVTYDGLGIQPRLAVARDNLRSTAVAGETVAFRTSSNYGAWVQRSEIRITDRKNPGKVIAIVPVQPNGSFGWTMPGDGPAELEYALRVYDTAGRFDETRKVPLTRTSRAMAGAELDGQIIAAIEGDDMTVRRAIPVRGGAVTVSGSTVGGGSVIVMGERAVADASGSFVIQRILPPGQHDIVVGVGGGDVTRSVDIPKQDWFYVGLADATFGKDNGGDSYAIGRLAGYAKGHTASGYTITASVDTREGDLKDLFRDLGEKDPDRVLRRITGDDVYPTFGDDSTSFDDAPTSGKVYLRVEKGPSSVMWGDFKADKGASLFVRSDRTLYGLQAIYESQDQTSFGEPRLRASGYAAEPDRLVQRDVLRGTGGSAYFLKRQDILAGTETLAVQYRDPVSGNVVRTETLVLGEDYEIDYFQGVVILKRPLSASAGAQLGSDRPLGDYDVNLVAQYEYVPTLGSVDGYSVDGRVEGWVNDSVRLGVSAANETTGVADNRIMGGDVLLRQSERTFLSLNYARSEGPGFGNAFSLNGGLDLDPSASDPSVNPSAGVLGVPADAYRIEGQADLAELTGGRVSGDVAAYFDHKDKGFVSADYDIATTQESYGVKATVDMSARSKLNFGYEAFKDDAGKERRDLRLGMTQQISDVWTLDAALVDTDRTDPAGGAGANGARTDLGIKLTWSRDEDLSLWAFGNATLRKTGGLADNNRLGFGGEARLTDRLSFAGEISDGSLGLAGEALLRWDNAKGSQYHLGYRLDPLRSTETNNFSGSDGGTWVVGGTRQVSDTVVFTGENTYDLKGAARSLTTAYGVRYTPSDKWSYSANMEFGETENATTGTITRRAIGGAVDFSDADHLKAGVKLEYRKEDSTDGSQNRDTWLLSGYTNYKLSDDARLVFDLKALVSDSDQSSFRDGKYILANLGYAYRPADNDRLNVLARYTYVYDLPGVDQVNIDGDVEGPKQKSHIFSIDANYDLNERWTLGGKYGYRLGQVADRGTNNFTDATADLAILRLDYHVAHNWDLMAEARMMNFKETKASEYGLVTAGYRHFGNNFKLGLGYQWGEVNDDLKSLKPGKEGVFLNIIGKF